jgi:hypothetical protein
MNGQLHYGCDRYCERSDGLRVDDNYPLSCDLVADGSDPLLTVLALKVDNSFFYE